MKEDNMDKLERFTASELGQHVNEGKIKPSEVVKYFIERIEKRNTSINAVVYKKYDEAIQKAYSMDKKIEEGAYLGPFAGVPFILKDFLPNKKGWVSTHGGVKCLESIDSVNSVFCDAMESLGGIALGKANAPAYGFRGTTDNKMFGVTKNPFNLSYNPGGSSGGSAASVADGLCLIAEGGDAGGSIRVPASFNNLFGFKAGISVIPSVSRPDAFSASHPYCFNGGLTKSVLDTAILLNAMSYYDPLDPLSRPMNINYVKEMNQSVKGLKIAYTTDFDIFEVEPRVKEKFLNIVDSFKEIGLETEEIHFNFNHTANELANMWCLGITLDPTIEINLEKEKGNDLLNEHYDEFPEEFIYWKEKCDEFGVMDLYKFNLARTAVLDEFERVFKEYDFILSPISCVEAIKNADDRNTKGPDMINGKKIEPLIGWAETFLPNFTGHPSCSIPAGFINEANIPFGIQAIGKKFNDGKLLALAHAYELHKPWKDNYKVALNRIIK